MSLCSHNTSNTHIQYSMLYPPQLVHPPTHCTPDTGNTGEGEEDVQGLESGEEGEEEEGGNKERGEERRREEGKQGIISEGGHTVGEVEGVPTDLLEPPSLQASR